MEHSFFSDFELLKAIRQNDEKAFAELFNRYWKDMYALIFAGVRSEEGTKEIVQDLFISLWNKRSTLRIDDLPSYLHAAGKSRVIDYVASQTIEALEDGIDQLPEKSKKIFTLNRLDGRSITETANILNLSETAIQYHITQSIKKLRLHLKDYILTGAFLAYTLI